MGYTVDGIHYLVDEPRPFSTSYSSHKFGKKAALCYEIVVCTFKSKIAWLNGPYPAGMNDKTIFEDKLKQAIETKQTQRNNAFRIIADDGYFKKTLTTTLSFRNEFDPRDIAYYKDRSLSRHEFLNGKTKNFKCLTASFRHDHGTNPEKKHPTHKACVEAVCVTLQYEMDLGLLRLFNAFPK